MYLIISSKFKTINVIIYFYCYYDNIIIVLCIMYVVLLLLLFFIIIYYIITKLQQRLDNATRELMRCAIITRLQEQET